MNRTHQVVISPLIIAYITKLSLVLPYLREYRRIFLIDLSKYKYLFLITLCFTSDVCFHRCIDSFNFSVKLVVLVTNVRNICFAGFIKSKVFTHDQVLNSADVSSEQCLCIYCFIVFCTYSLCYLFYVMLLGLGRLTNSSLDLHCGGRTSLGLATNLG